MSKVWLNVGSVHGLILMRFSGALQLNYPYMEHADQIIKSIFTQLFKWTGHQLTNSIYWTLKENDSSHELTNSSVVQIRAQSSNSSYKSIYWSIDSGSSGSFSVRPNVRLSGILKSCQWWWTHVFFYKISSYIYEEEGIKVAILKWLPCWSKEARFKLLYNTTLVLMRTPKEVHSVLDHILLKRYKKRVKSWGENAGGWVLMIIPSGNGCGSTVAIMQKVSPKKVLQALQ